MRWLQWATYNLKDGFGGVEMHARCVCRELKKLGVDAHLSSDPEDLENKTWDVIHTHGTGTKLAPEILNLIKRQKKAIRVHGVHGTTPGRMAACKEWTWPGGYYAMTKEFISFFNSNIVLVDHENIFFYKLAKMLGKKTAVASNGWDTFATSDILEEPLPPALLEQINKFNSFWIYYGRGGDHVKACERIIEAKKSLPDLNLVASPGEGFEKDESVVKTGHLTQGQLKTLSKMAAGLTLTSKYEGLPLVVMEALGEGMPVVATPVGGIVTISQNVEGLYLSENQEVVSITQAFIKGMNANFDKDSRHKRAIHNQKIIASWSDVAKCALSAVNEFINEKKC